MSTYSLYFVYLFIAKAVCTYVYMVCFTVVAANVSAALRMKYLHTTLHRRIAFHETAITTGDVSLALSTHSNTIRAGLAEKFGLSLKSLSTIVAAFIVALTAQWKLALVTATLVPAIVVIVGVPGALDEKLEKSLNEVKAQAATLAEEIFSSVRTVRALGAEGVLSSRYEALLKTARQIGLRRAPFKGLVAGLYMFTLYSGYALAFWYGVKLFADGQVKSSGVVVTTLFSIIIAVNGFAELTSYSGAIVRIHSAANELFKAIDGTDNEFPAPVPDPPTSDLDNGIFRRDIRLDDVSFAYPTRPDTTVLDRLDLVCPAGQTTALVGPSGSGKSTVVGLALRWYDAAQGCVSIGGRSLTEVSFQELRANIGLVQQEPCLFTGTVYENVANGLAGTEMQHLSVDDKRALVTDACKTSNAHEFITTLPQVS